MFAFDHYCTTTPLFPPSIFLTRFRCLLSTNFHFPIKDHIFHPIKNHIFQPSLFFPFADRRSITIMSKTLDKGFKEDRISLVGVEDTALLLLATEMF